MAPSTSLEFESKNLEGYEISYPKSFFWWLFSDGEVRSLGIWVVWFSDSCYWLVFPSRTFPSSLTLRRRNVISAVFEPLGSLSNLQYFDSNLSVEPAHLRTQLRKGRRNCRARSETAYATWSSRIGSSNERLFRGHVCVIVAACEMNNYILFKFCHNLFKGLYVISVSQTHSVQSAQTQRSPDFLSALLHELIT